MSDETEREMSAEFHEYLRCLEALCRARALTPPAQDEISTLQGDLLDAEQAVGDDEREAARANAWRAWPKQLQQRVARELRLVPRPVPVFTGEHEAPRRGPSEQVAA